MAVKFNVVQKRNPQKPNDPQKHYASSIAAGEVSLKQLSKRISSMSTVNSGDILAVLDLLNQVMIEELSDGNIVRFGEFGSFQISISAQGQDSADKVTGTTVKSAKIAFRPGKDLKNMLATISYEKA